MLINTTEDNYIKYLAGIKEGSNPISWDVEWDALSAQKHPRSNKLFASIKGIALGTMLNGLVILASPFTNSTIRGSIIGPNVCISCGFSVHKLTTITNLYNIAILKQYWEGIKLGVGTASACVLDTPIADLKVVTPCRVANYLASIYDTVTYNSILLPTATFAMIAAITIWQLGKYEASENKAEEALINQLEDTFTKIANRLEDKKSDPKMQAYAQQILENRVEINKEIEKLHLPSLKWKNIEDITQPVFQAALHIAKQRLGVAPF